MKSRPAKRRGHQSPNGSAYPEGFTITVAAADPISLPLNIQAALTSNPKQIEDDPQLGSELTGFVDERGNFKVANFRLRDDAYEHFEEKAEHETFVRATMQRKRRAAAKTKRVCLVSARRQENKIRFHPRDPRLLI